jgi:hypothetical protein
MGFVNNLDRYDWQNDDIVVEVQATWGWAVIPEDVKLATAWTIQDALVKPSSDDLRSEGIAGYNRAFGSTPEGSSLALPNRARDILSNYARPY